MSWSYPVGRLFGSELRVHATFLLLLAWVGISAWTAEGPGAAVGSVLFILALFACVVAHEFGHALMARRYGIRTPRITLLPIGGVAQLERLPTDPRQEIAVALAGPLVNVVIFVVIALLGGVAPGMAELETLDGSITDFTTQLAAVNLFLAVFNLIPAFPMDGGRVLRALLAIWMDRARATQVAAGLGQAVAVAFALFGLLSGNLILMLIALFVFAAATAESAHEQLRAVAQDLRARDAMITQFTTLAPGDGLMAMSAGLLRTTQHEFPVVDASGALLGFVTRDAIFQAAAGDGRVIAADVMARQISSVPLEAPLIGVLDELGEAEHPAVAVTDRGGNFLGYITRENIGELMVLERQRAARG